MVRVFVTVIEALAISWALLYLGEYFDWRWVREAGGLPWMAALSQVTNDR